MWYTKSVLRLPAALERRLSELFPRTRDREKFVTELIAEALEGKTTEETPPEFVGGSLHLFTDGGSRGNPGQAAIAGILEDPVHGRVLEEFKETIGVETNNVAEYQALIQGLKMAQRYQPNRLICHLDSELIVRQLSGQYQVKMATLKPYYDEIKELVTELPDVVFVHVPREDNYRADALVNQALDAEFPPGHKQIITSSSQPKLPLKPPVFRPPGMGR